MRNHLILLAAMLPIFSSSCSRSSPPKPPETDDAVVLLNFIFAELRPRLQPGISTIELASFVEGIVSQTDAVAYFKGYRGYPAIMSTPINEEVVHTLPSSRKLKEGDLLTIELGIRLNGLHAYQGWTFPVGEISEADSKILHGAQKALERAVAAAHLPNRVSDISSEIETNLAHWALAPSRDFVGYQIGSEAHMAPQIPGFAPTNSIQSPRLQEGMRLAIIVIAHSGSPQVGIAKDGWNVMSTDGKKAVVFSHIVQVGAIEPQLLTKPLE